MEEDEPEPLGDRRKANPSRGAAGVEVRHLRAPLRRQPLPAPPQELPLHPTASCLPVVADRGVRPRQPAGRDWEAAPPDSGGAAYSCSWQLGCGHGSTSSTTEKGQPH
ncbi:hypothetical protein GQ55_8G054400 [Panicum hallii var. hallii]|uniref:Uncharacterized protein n=1 Tax=Panicum hallii var. hallii TaxID=1504633 RepID=A0A2T7CL10_9POAL|nr:hypothetical protein GQ55_J003900 [Panicum hallii var. hallii]PUZ44016.1 hypothetical protein GQ55_8G054400 [Panicum hallii var. hallii]